VEPQAGVVLQQEFTDAAFRAQAPSAQLGADGGKKFWRGTPANNLQHPCEHFGHLLHCALLEQPHELLRKRARSSLQAFTRGGTWAERGAGTEHLAVLSVFGDFSAGKIFGFAGALLGLMR